MKRLWKRLLRRPEPHLVIDLRDQPPEFLLAAHRLAELLPQQRDPNDVDWMEYR